MRKLRNGLSALMTVLAFSGAAAGGVRADEDEISRIDELAPVAVEFFISQACERCPPAGEYLVDLADRSDVVALGWHVDLWNMIARGDAGRWQDPFSKDVYSERQRLYNRNIRKRGTVFTPQAVVAGVKTAVGSNRDAVEALIAAARSEPAMAAQMSRRGDALSITIDGAEEPCEAILVTFRRTARTPITGGDNAGLTFVEANVVTDVLRLGAVGREGREFTAPAPGDGQGCALLLQGPGQGRILSAAYCPAEV